MTVPGRSPIATLAVALGAFVAGCSDDEGDFVPASLPECPSHDYRTCDTRQAACQQRLLALTACVYGAETVPTVPVHVLTAAELRELLEADLEDELAMRTPEELAATELLESALVDLRLAQSGALSAQAKVDDFVENLAGVYLDSENGVLLIDHGTPTDDVEANALLVHELVHALQDADYDLETWLTPYLPFTDSLLAARAVTEGQATLYQFRVAMAMLGHRAQDIDLSATLLGLRDDLDRVAREDPSPYAASGRTFPYGHGSAFAHGAWLEAERGFERELIASPPLGTHEVMLRVENPRASVAPPEELPEPADTGDYALLDHDVLGGWLLRLFLEKHDYAGGAADELAARWAADHLWLYRDGADNGGWLWQIALTGDAEPLGGIETELPEGVTIEYQDGRAFLAGGTDGAPQALLDAGRAFLSGP